MNELWKCVKCGWEIIDNEGECGINGICEDADGIYADTPCPRCGERLKQEKENNEKY